MSAVELNPLVSVIIPAYRQVDYLTAAIDSVLKQSFQPIEIIVVSDGQHDATDLVVERLGGRIHYHVQSHAGASNARNTGLGLASGKYILFLDADDLLHPDAVTWLLDAMDGKENRLCVTGYGRFQGRDPVEGLIGCECLPPVDAPPLAYLIRRNFAAIHCFLAPRKRLMEVGGFDTSLRWCEDWDLWLRLALAGAEIKTVPRVGAYYRQTPGSMSSQSQAMLEGRAEVVLRTHRLVLNDRHLTHEWAPALVETEQHLLRQLLALNWNRELQMRLWQGLQEMAARGHCPPRSSAKQLVDQWLGFRAESLAIAWFRIFDRRRFAFYCHH